MDKTHALLYAYIDCPICDRRYHYVEWDLSKEEEADREMICSSCRHKFKVNLVLSLTGEVTE